MTTTWAAVRHGAGRNILPALLVEHWTRLSEDELRRAVHDAWTMPEWPEQALSADGWLNLFDLSEYQVDGKTADRDKDLPEIVTLFRGAIEERRHGLSWTSDLARARWFADRFTGLRHTTVGHVWRIDIPRDYVLARFTTRGEHEHVVDTSGFEEDEYVLVEPERQEATS